MRAFNFSAGPAALPEVVLRQAAEEMLDWHGSGMSVMEMSHRGREFMSIHEAAMTDLRDLLAVPANYRILFLQGGGIGENAIVPMNLLGNKTVIDFLVTGVWSQKSLREASKYATARVVADGRTEHGYTTVPAIERWQCSSDAAYLHVCTNETINGVEMFDFPDTGKVPLVADISSHALSRPMDVTRCGAVFAGAQKNIGIAGLTMVIVRDDLLDRALPMCPSAFEWNTVSANDSMFNTPPTYAIYIAGLVFKWLKVQGGLAAMERINLQKSSRLYEAIDASSLYSNRVDTACRSRMNVPFFLADETLNQSFLEGAKAQGLLQLKGHKAVGGMRASIYNAVPLAAVEALISYMRDFERLRA
jgi:phosphoserine aminotransferase